MAVRFLGFVVNGVHQQEMPDEWAERFWEIYYDVMGYEPVEENEKKE